MNDDIPRLTRAEELRRDLAYSMARWRRFKDRLDALRADGGSQAEMQELERRLAMTTREVNSLAEGVEYAKHFDEHADWRGRYF
jgi:hypothetical protein